MHTAQHIIMKMSRSCSPTRGQCRVLIKKHKWLSRLDLLNSTKQTAVLACIGVLQFEGMGACRIFLMAFLLIIHNSSGSGSKGSTEPTDEKLGSSLEAIESDAGLGESGSQAGPEGSEGSGMGAAGSDAEDEVVKVMEKLGNLLEQVKDGLQSQSEDEKTVREVLEKLLDIQQRAFEKTEVKDVLKELLDLEKKAQEKTEMKKVLQELVNVQKKAGKKSFEDLTGTRALFKSMKEKKMTEGSEEIDKETFHIFEQKDRDPEAALGILRLNSDYNKNEAPNRKVKAWLEPTFVADIDSMARRMGLEMKLYLMWEDERIIWRMEDIMYPGAAFHFDPSILR